MIPQRFSPPTLTGIVRSVHRVRDFAATVMNKRSVAGLRSTMIRAGPLNSEVWWTQPSCAAQNVLVK
jgi:hypothetical protein